MREQRGAAARRAHFPRGHAFLILATAGLVLVDITAIVGPFWGPGRAAAEPPAVSAESTAPSPPVSPASASSGAAGSGLYVGQDESSQPTAAGAVASATNASPQPSPSASCLPAPYRACDTIPAPTVLPSIAIGGSSFTLHVPILEYHRVKPLQNETGFQVSLVVPPDLFASQMDALRAAGWQTITMGQLGDDLRRGIAPQPKSFVVTFDDGYEDGFLYAHPVLERDGFAATYFVIGDQIDQPDRLTVAELQALVATGNEIGNHSMSHQNLRVMSADRLVTETFGASVVIARDVGLWPQSYAYPIGLTDDRVISALALCPGIETAVIQGGPNPESWLNRFQLPGFGWDRGPTRRTL